ncbi:MAG: hypothetical protein ACO271_14740 [Burkholderiales bacterium]
MPPIVRLKSWAFPTLARGDGAHAAEAPPERNMPMLMGLIGLWHHNFCGGASRAVISYEPGLALLPPYLQQLEMESLGKSVTQKGKALRTGSGTVVWGNLGIEAQHAYMQALHQGTQLVPVDFIAACSARNGGDADTQSVILASCFAQSALLMQGVSEDDIKQQLTANGMDAKEAARLAPHQALPGNRPSNTLLLPSLTPHSLGALLALYEHRTFVKAAILDVNAFDQYGVEHGKKLAGSLLPELNGKAPTETHDASTSALIRHVLKNNGRTP